MLREDFKVGSGILSDKKGTNDPEEDGSMFPKQKS
jgi:hypothetical protein